MIIIVVLGVIAILLSLVTNLSSEASFASQMMATVRHQDRTYYVAQSAVIAVRPLMPSASDSAHTLQDPWALGVPPLRIDGFLVSVKITDEERYINPNAILKTDGTINEDQVKMFRRLLLLLGHRDEEIVNALLDWMDVDSTRRLPGGAEGKDYGERLPKNGLLDSVDEILQVKEMPSDLLTGPAEPETSSTAAPGGPASAAPAGSAGATGGSVKRGLRDFISVYGSGTINVNTAPPLVLLAMAEKLDAGLVSAIVQRREREPFKKLEDMLEVPGLTRDHLYFIKKVADVKSSTWRVRADVGFDTGESTLQGPPETTLVAIYRGSGKGIKPLAWNLDEIGNGADEASSFASPGASPTAWPQPASTSGPTFGAPSGPLNPTRSSPQKF